MWLILKYFAFCRGNEFNKRPVHYPEAKRCKKRLLSNTGILYNYMITSESK